VERGRAGFAELGEMLAREAQVLLLQVGAARLGFGTQPRALLIACALLRFLFRTRGVVGGTPLVHAVAEGEAAAGEREVVPARFAEGALGFVGVRAGGRCEPGKVATPAPVP
jgi:hypothetical protein